MARNNSFYTRLLILLLGSIFCEGCYYSNCPNRWKWKRDGREQKKVVVAAVPEAIAMTKELSAATSSVNLLRSFLKDQLDVVSRAVSNTFLFLNDSLRKYIGKSEIIFSSQFFRYFISYFFA